MTRSAYSSGNLFLLAITYLFYFGQFGVFIPYLGLFLDRRGLSSTEIGELFALITFARIAGPNLWAAIADHTGKSLRLLQLGALLTLSMFCLAFWLDGFWSLTISLAFGIGGAVGGYISGGLWQQGLGAELAFTLAAVVAFVSACCLLPVTSKRM